ncbi:hypothetical protein D515_03649 [Grimontia indica]|uniref:Uncharacterized protein n=1 Tax=Grimontia indica TaxID=1056512 RepID=R1IJH5_9GAMM|nr:hypothetical protein D515_03649 [Grimontia indica]
MLFLAISMFTTETEWDNARRFVLFIFGVECCLKDALL